MDKKFSLMLFLAASIALLSATQPLRAQQAERADTDKSSGVLEEVVVTAQRREQSIQDVGVAVEATSGDLLRLSGIHSTTDLVQTSPSVSISGAVAGQTLQYSIRGVSQADYFDAIEPPVAVYVDDIYIPSMQAQGVSVYDVQRVEILKGPQGTLFGRNATGGLVHTLTNKPDISKTEGYADVSYASHNQQTFESAINTPISSIAAVRVSGYYDRLGDYLRNVGTGPLAPGFPVDFGSPGVGPASPGHNLGGYENKSGRVQLLIQPNDRLSVRLTASIAEGTTSGGPWFAPSSAPVFDAQGRWIDSVRIGPTDTRLGIGPGGAAVTNPALLGFLFGSPSAATGSRFYPGGTWYGFPRLDPQNNVVADDHTTPGTRESWIFGAHVDYDFTDGLHFASVTGLQRHQGNFAIDVDAQPVNLLSYGSRGDVKPFSQEFRLSGKSDDLRWVTGLFYLRNSAHVTDGIMALPGSLFAAVVQGGFPTQLPGVADAGVDMPTVTVLNTHSTSAFGQVEWDFAPKTTLVGGARFINEKQDYHYDSYFAKHTDDARISDATYLLEAQPSYSDKRTQHLWAGKLQLEYRPTREWLAYTGINRGVKAGSYNAKIADLSPPMPPANFAYRPEVLLNYESGFKFTTKRWLLNADVFYYDYRDYQNFLFNNLNGAVSNANSKDHGAEAETTYLLTDSLTFNLSASYLSTKIANYVIAPGVTRDVQHTYSPKNKYQANFRYRSTTDVGGGRFGLFAQVAHTGSQYDGIKNFSATLLPAYTISNFAVSWERESGLSVTVFANNAFDKRYAVVGVDNTMISGATEEVYGKPASYGLTLGYRF